MQKSLRYSNAIQRILKYNYRKVIHTEDLVMRVLLVEDEIRLADALAYILKKKDS